jgi:hypothetical protein
MDTSYKWIRYKGFDSEEKEASNSRRSAFSCLGLRSCQFPSPFKVSGPAHHGHNPLHLLAMEDHQLYKFPRTRHIYDTGGGATRDDLVRRTDCLCPPQILHRLYRAALSDIFILIALDY